MEKAAIDLYVDKDDRPRSGGTEVLVVAREVYLALPDNLIERRVYLQELLEAVDETYRKADGQRYVLAVKDGDDLRVGGKRYVPADSVKPDPEPERERLDVAKLELPRTVAKPDTRDVVTIEKKLPGGAARWMLRTYLGGLIARGAWETPGLAKSVARNIFGGRPDTRLDLDSVE